MTRHVPVMVDRCAELLLPALAGEAVLVDMTVGLGGHAEALLERVAGLRVIGIDRDSQALELAAARLARFGDRFTPVHGRYDDVAAVLARAGTGPVAGVLADLGISSLQIDEAERGFSYVKDAPLDMRMDRSGSLTAAEVVNGYSQAELARVLREYGEERYAVRIARAVVAARSTAPLRRTGELAALVHGAVPPGTPGGDPAKRTFQAIRIEVNGEIEVLQRALPDAIDCLAVGGRLVVLAYHSLEDRLVKRELARGAESTAPRGLPVELPSQRPYLRLLTRGAERPTAAERSQNPRSASARLRAAERIRQTSGRAA